MRKNAFIMVVIAMLIIIPTQHNWAAQKDGHDSKVEDTKYKIPESVLSITKENTYPNPSQDSPMLEPSELSKQLLGSSNVKIENPELIHMLNETNIGNNPVAFWYRATVYLGKWALNYESMETSPNWEYQKINTNFYDNRGGDTNFQIHYVQESQKVVRGGLTAKVPSSEDIKKMMLARASEKSKLPLAFETVVGGGTKKDRVYNIPPMRLGYLYGYAPAINEKGKVTYGEVYLVLKGSKREIIVRNVTSQGIGAWIPIQDHVSYQFRAVNRPY
jgi:hypothetical protein